MSVSLQPKLRFKGDIGVTFPEWKKTLFNKRSLYIKKWVDDLELYR